MATTRADKVFEFSTKAVSRAQREYVDSMTNGDDLRTYAIAMTLQALQFVLKDKTSAFQFTQKFLLPYWKVDQEGAQYFDTKQLEKDGRDQIVQQVTTLVKTRPELADELENTEEIMEKFHQSTTFLIPYFTAMCDYASCE